MEGGRRGGERGEKGRGPGGRERRAQALPESGAYARGRGAVRTVAGGAGPRARCLRWPRRAEDRGLLR